MMHTIVTKTVSTIKELNMNALETLFTIIGGLVFLIFLSFLLSLPAMWLWNNALVGAVNGVNEVSWLQAWGISILCNFLFKNSVSTKKQA